MDFDNAAFTAAKQPGFQFLADNPDYTLPEHLDAASTKAAMCKPSEPPTIIGTWTRDGAYGWAFRCSKCWAAVPAPQ